MIKALVKSAFRRLGYDLRRRTGHRWDMTDTCAFLSQRGFSPATVIDVGVAYGTPELYRSFPKARFLLVEPLVEWEPTLKRIASEYNAEYVVAAAGPTSGTLTLNVHPVSSQSSLFSESDGAQADGVPRDVPTVRLDDVCKEKGFKGPYLLKVDTQGAELLVLTGASEVLGETEAVILEVSLFQFFKGGPQFHEVVEFMARSGFVLYDLSELSLRPLDGALGQMCATFVKENGYFRQTHGWATAEQRTARESHGDPNWDEISAAVRRS